jgi:hypothetical protein
MASPAETSQGSEVKAACNSTLMHRFNFFTRRGQDWFIMSGNSPLDWTFYEHGDDVITVL